VAVLTQSMTTSGRQKLIEVFVTQLTQLGTDRLGSGVGRFGQPEDVTAADRDRAVADLIREFVSRSLRLLDAQAMDLQLAWAASQEFAAYRQSDEARSAENENFSAADVHVVVDPLPDCLRVLRER
jgi:hypothetical protein